MVLTLAYERNEVKYVWMNEADSVFAKEGSLVEVPYVEPSLWEVLMSSPWFQGLMTYEWIIWKKLCVIFYFIWYVLYEYVMCCVQYYKYDYSCYSHGMTFLFQFDKSTDFPNPNLASLLTWLSINHVVRIELFLIMHILGVFLHIPILSTSVN